MTVDEKKLLIQGMVEKLSKSNERESTLRKELADDRLTLERVEEMQLAADPIPVDSTYESYEAWIASIEKEISRGENSIANIQEQKVEVEALQYYLDNVV